MDRIACVECRQCNRKGKPSVLRFSKYCDDHHIYRVKTKKKKLAWFTDIKNKFVEKRTEYDDEGKMKDMNTKGFRNSWFWR